MRGFCKTTSNTADDTGSLEWQAAQIKHDRNEDIIFGTQEETGFIICRRILRSRIITTTSTTVAAAGKETRKKPFLKE